LGEALIGHAGQGNQKLAFKKAFALVNFWSREDAMATAYS